jgi:hypothetical protein
MPVEKIAPAEREAILRVAHVAHIDEDTQRILAARACGCPVDEIAEQLHLARSSVYRALERVQVAIFDPRGLKHDQWAAARWFSHHSACCVAFAAGLITNGRILPREEVLKD